MKLLYKSEPPRSVELQNDGKNIGQEDLLWQYHTLPLGNGYFGACVYGYTDTECVQITENSFANPYKSAPAYVKDRSCNCGVTSFCNLHLDFPHSEHGEYARELDLERAVCTVSYRSGGVGYRREYFTSYPDRALVIRISADRAGALSFSAGVEIPYVADYCHVEGDGLARSGEVSAKDGCISAESTLGHYGVTGYGVLSVQSTDGEVKTVGERIYVSGASEAVLIYTMGTNYRLESRVFTEDNPSMKLSPYPHPRAEVKRRIKALSEISYGDLLQRHTEDYRSLYVRARVELGTCADADKTVHELLDEVKEGGSYAYLSSLLFTFGRYLLISSSRRGALPANLQGVWSSYRSSPWSAGYWHNINVQMNYWPSTVANLTDCFLSYSDYSDAYMPSAKKHADRYVRELYPERKGEDGDNGWIIGTGAWPYKIEGASRHSGPGTGAFTSLLFWDYYDYTRDTEYLREKVYPVLRDMSLFFSRTLEWRDGKYLVGYSASPEQPGPDGSYYQTVGCAFDQQMIYENYSRTLQAAELLGIDEPLLDTVREQIDKLDPCIIGASGQIKEFREEEYYGEIGEEKHRHISHLVALYPGVSINGTTPELERAASYTLMRRGDGSTGWACIHRLCCLARLGESESCARITRRFLSNYLGQNLWAQHPPFQIDANLGFVAAMAEMLISSHSGYITLLPALPSEWADGTFYGLLARGGFEVDCRFAGGKPSYARICSLAGELLRIELPKGATVLKDGKGHIHGGGVYSATTVQGETVEIFY